MSKDGRTKVLFVCVGNACRSPMAEAIARVDAPDVIEAFSAGLAPIGSVAGMTKQTLMKNGYWVEGLEPKGISSEIWEQADIVINLSGRAREQAFRECSKVEDWEIDDPFGQDLDIYQQTFEKIRLRVADLAQECRKKEADARSRERRARARLHLSSPIFVNLDGTNTGTVFNISEDGLALSPTATLPEGSYHKIWIQFPGFRDWIEASGLVAWRSKSKQEAGVRFVGLKQEARRQIRNWISSQTFPGDFQEQTKRICEEQNLHLGVPDPQQTQDGFPGSCGQNGKRFDKKTLPSSLKSVRDQRRPGAPRRRWGTFAASGVMIALVSLTFEWITMRPDIQMAATTTVTQKPDVLSGAVQGLAHPAADTTPSFPGLSDTIDRQALNSQPLPPERSKTPGISPEEVDRQARTSRAAGSTSVKTSSLAAKNVLAPSQAVKEPPPAVTSASSRLAERVQPLSVGSLPSAPAPFDAKIAPPAISAPNVPTDAPQFDLKEVRSPMPPAKQPVIPAGVTAAVAIVADPYPSLRMPDGGISKKQRQAATLQLGHLLSRVEPIYPEEAKQKGIQGTVKLHAIIGRQGSVENLDSVDGSPVLAEAAVNAVRQWHYTPTLLAGRSVETEEDIAITFRLSNSTSPTN